MRGAVIGLFGLVFITMVTVTVRSRLPVIPWDGLPGLLEDPWAVATVFEAYLGFLIFYAWVTHKEPSAGRRAARFLLVMGLGSIATSFYLLMQPVCLRPGRPAWEILRREP